MYAMQVANDLAYFVEKSDTHYFCVHTAKLIVHCFDRKRDILHKDIRKGIISACLQRWTDIRRWSGKARSDIWSCNLSLLLFTSRETVVVRCSLHSIICEDSHISFHVVKHWILQTTGFVRTHTRPRMAQHCWSGIDAALFSKDWP